MSTTAIFALPSPKRRQSLERAVSEYAECVEVAGEYLTGRGIPIEVAKAWRLGYVLDPNPGHEEYKRRLSIPYLTPGGVVDVKFRCMDHDRWDEPAKKWANDCKDMGHPKYLAEVGSGSHLFGVWNLRRESRILCICEGELDTIACWSIAGLPAVGVAGVNRWQKYWRILMDYEDVVILADGDNAGKTFSQRVAGEVYNSRIVAMPSGHDVNSFILQYGAQALRDRVGVNEQSYGYSNVA